FLASHSSSGRFASLVPSGQPRELICPLQPIRRLLERPHALPSWPAPGIESERDWQTDANIGVEVAMALTPEPRHAEARSRRRVPLWVSAVSLFTISELPMDPFTDSTASFLLISFICRGARASGARYGRKLSINRNKRRKQGV